MDSQRPAGGGNDDGSFWLWETGSTWHEQLPPDAFFESFDSALRRSGLDWDGVIGDKTYHWDRFTTGERVACRLVERDAAVELVLENLYFETVRRLQELDIPISDDITSLTLTSNLRQYLESKEDTPFTCQWESKANGETKVCELSEKQLNAILYATGLLDFSPTLVRALPQAKPRLYGPVIHESKERILSDAELRLFAARIRSDFFYLIMGEPLGRNERRTTSGPLTDSEIVKLGEQIESEQFGSDKLASIYEQIRKLLRSSDQVVAKTDRANRVTTYNWYNALGGETISCQVGEPNSLHILLQIENPCHSTLQAVQEQGVTVHSSITPTSISFTMNCMSYTEMLDQQTTTTPNQLVPPPEVHTEELPHILCLIHYGAALTSEFPISPTQFREILPGVNLLKSIDDKK